MANYNYAFQGYKNESMARAAGKDIGISTKVAIEMCNMLRKKKLQSAKLSLERVLKKQEAVPFKRFTDGVGHRKGMAAGRYPFKASTEILKLLKSAEVNAQSKGLNTGSLVITHICAHKAFSPMRYGRQSRRMAKKTHVEVVLTEAAPVKKKEKVTKVTPNKEAEVKAELKKEVPKATETPAPKVEAKPQTGTTPEAKSALKPEVKLESKPAVAESKESKEDKK